MSDTPPEDFQHLPTADADAARAAKAALWKQIAEQRKQSRAAATPPVEPAPEPEPPAPEEPLPAPQRPSSRDEWAELFAMNPDEAAGSTLPALNPSPAASPAPRKRSVIRRNTPPVETPPEQPLLSESAPESPSTPEPAPESTVVSQPETPRSEPEPVREEPVVAEAPEKPRKNKTKISKHTEDSPASATTPKAETPKDADAKPAEQKAPKDGDAEGEKKPDADVLKKDSPVVRLLRQKWVQWGGASLSLSLGIHLLILGVGGFLVVNQVLLEPQVDFLPGGTQQGQQASQELQHKVQQKKQPWNKKIPKQKIAAVGSISEIVLPDEVPDLLDLPSANNMLANSKVGGGLGGGGFGKGMGLGAKGGMVFQPLSMFGREIKAKKLALVLDVSSSMAPFLPKVIEEVDKVARGSIIVLFPGCGLEAPPGGGLSGDEVYRTNGTEFERFWRSGGMSSISDARKFKFSRNDPIPSESIYNILSNRPQTFFVHYVGVGYAWTALLSEQVRQADALYWFSDFQDSANFQQLEIVRENLLRRKQKLYIQPYTHGSSFDLVRTQLVEPTGGEVIEANMQ
ncbi:hypothetical protein [Brevifollis gellanilyticus]|uniref:Uncharacterized protein n=1 Tax=Brevifollis gellanilyticus TaxID=748831 RepID=A0A512M709_9BACT|nr:hypothetical protein [Brevifollis gellanilyticus]GEP42504.1 hypothetical protein BGE01nite_17950 [Brevifollis gellanilyticus]